MEENQEASASPTEDIKRLDNELLILTARVEGMGSALLDSEARIAEVTEAVANLAKLTADFADHVVAASGTDVRPATDRKTWVVTVPEGDEYKVGPVQVLIEQFGDRPPTVAFRHDRWNTWGRPFGSEVAP